MTHRFQSFEPHIGEIASKAAQSQNDQEAEKPYTTSETYAT